MAGYYHPGDKDHDYWTSISDHKSHYVDDIADPWIEWELGLRVHDYILQSEQEFGTFGWDALDDLSYAEYCEKEEKRSKTIEIDDIFGTFP